MITFTSTSTGNGDFTFAENASTQLQVGDTFQAQIYSLILVNGIEDINWSEYEISNTCVYNGSNTFTRGAVFESSANNARVSFSPGSKRIYINLPVEKTIRNDTGVAITNNAISFYGTVGTNAQLLTSNGSTSSWQNAPAGITPGGANTNIQFNDSGVFGGNAGLTFNKTTNAVVVGNSSINAVVNSTSMTISNSTIVYMLSNRVGEFFWHTGNTAPAHALHANGQAVSRTTYVSLWNFVQGSGNYQANASLKTEGNYGPGNGSTTFTLPDLKTGGEFIRAWDGVGSFGRWEDHQLQLHDHDYTYVGMDTVTQSGTNNRRHPAVASTTGTSGPTGNFGTETRPINVSWLPCICFR